MAPYKNPLAVVQGPRRDPKPPAPYVSYQDRFDDEVRTQSFGEVRPLEDQLTEPGPAARFNDLVTDLLSGDETLPSPAPGRRSPEHDASSGAKGAGDGQHLCAVGAEVVQLQPFRDARDRRPGRFRSFSRPTGGSAA